MCSVERTVDLGFTAEPYSAGVHMCLIYDDEEERRQVIGRFLQSGLSSKERVAYFPDEPTPARMAEALKRLGVDFSRQGGDSLTVAAAETTYCPTGIFEPEEMLGTLRAFYEEAVNGGYPACRISGEMSWALRDIPGTHRLMEYEAWVNRVLETHPVTAICQYDAHRFDGTTILRCLEVHPFMVVHGRIVHNPFYMKPEEFIRTYMSGE